MVPVSNESVTSSNSAFYQRSILSSARCWALQDLSVPEDRIDRKGRPRRLGDIGLEVCIVADGVDDAGKGTR